MNEELTLSRDQVREVDRRAIDEYGLPGIVLMENAGRGIADWMRQLAGGEPARACVCCGKGNNGGDGFVVARHLHNAGWEVEILLFASPFDLAGDAALNCHVAEEADYPMHSIGADLNGVAERLAGADWVVDALLGTGTTGEPRPPFGGAIEAINAAGKPVVAVDIPSGLDCDTGAAPGAVVRASHTATFVAGKPGFTNPDAAGYLGEIRVIDIGVPRKLIRDLVEGWTHSNS